MTQFRRKAQMKIFDRIVDKDDADDYSARSKKSFYSGNGGSGEKRSKILHLFGQANWLRKEDINFYLRFVFCYFNEIRSLSLKLKYLNYFLGY